MAVVKRGTRIIALLNYHNPFSLCSVIKQPYRVLSRAWGILWGGSGKSRAGPAVLCSTCSAHTELAPGLPGPRLPLTHTGLCFPPCLIPHSWASSHHHVSIHLPLLGQHHIDSYWLYGKLPILHPT